ncbi:hypothetical protein [Halolactibacillus sp. JCM 19043]|uniref:hypothetical protein n=1 Tax=Halolactibacillus sp. JCM 19043 TaxID=1460638 RepID=UPI000784E376|nr:hypothetical protein [Halolactibacillus sp. JCM 19043]
MQRILLSLIVLLSLTACGNNQVDKDNIEQVADGFNISEESAEERDVFIKLLNRYIENSDYDIDKINKDNLEEPRIENDLYWQRVQEGNLDLEFKYNLEGEIKGYHLSYNGNEDEVFIYISLMAKALGLDITKLVDNVVIVMNSADVVKTNEYTEEGYEISIIDSRELGYFIVNFDKTSQ